MEPPVLDTTRLRLRPHTTDDLDAVASMWADERVVRYINPKPSTRSESWTRLLRYIGHWHARPYGYWVIEDRETGGYLGETGFSDFKRDMTPSIEGMPEIGWVLIPDAHGRGIATEAVAAVLSWGDQELESDKTVCLFDPENAASIRVAEKNGYSVMCNTVLLDLPTLIMERIRVT